ncbi:SPOSA6832_02617 [Sporobolomyces salmonicolor]|uniref:Chromatin modification-related protein EAF6 n=1 Tax=Sporidiobolus salmonicolor TaxID=5005 RepID=A0A0D6ELT8_SPOSA|nr:SPOSA6832_02617 [Sporobolomyces salmonicolor]
MSASPAPSEPASQSATPAPQQANLANSTAQPPPAPPHPLEGLSPTDLRAKLDHSRKVLRAYLDKKRKLDRDLAALESSIHAFEGSYLSDALFPSSATSNAASAAAAQFGNIIRGYDSYLKAPSASGADRNKRVRTGEVNERERMFSASSATYLKSIELRTAEVSAGGAESASDDDTSSNSRRKRSRH